MLIFSSHTAVICELTGVSSKLQPHFMLNRNQFLSHTVSCSAVGSVIVDIRMCLVRLFLQKTEFLIYENEHKSNII